MNTVCEEEIAIIERCRSGRREAFEPIVKKYMKDAYHIALGLVGDREDALDISQEAFIRAYRNINKFRLDCGFFPWFYQILRNLCFTHLRKKRRRNNHITDTGDTEAVPGESNLSFSPESLAEKNEIKEKVWAAVGKLDEKHREVIILRHFQNLSYEQISKILFCNAGTVTSRLYYARRKLKELLDDEKGGWQE